MYKLPVAIFSTVLLSVAHASDHGCKVLLCLSNPNGWAEISQCVPPVQKLFRDLAKQKPFPLCDLGSAEDNEKNHAGLVRVPPYDPCPEGHHPTNASLIATGKVYKDPNNKLKHLVLTSRIHPPIRKREQRACVRNSLGRIYSPDHEKRVSVFESILWQPKQSMRAIEVIINGKRNNIVRF